MAIAGAAWTSARLSANHERVATMCSDPYQAWGSQSPDDRWSPAQAWPNTRTRYGGPKQACHWRLVERRDFSVRVERGYGGSVQKVSLNAVAARRPQLRHLLSCLDAFCDDVDLELASDCGER